MKYIKRSFGRLPSAFDLRDYNLRDFIPMGAKLSLDEVSEKVWEFPVDHEPLDQLGTQHCCGFSMANFGINYPVHRSFTDEDGHRFYYLVKEFENEPLGENGAHMRSAASVLRNLKLIDAYAFATDMTVIKWWLLNRGPMMVGTIWTSGMMAPNANNIISISGSMLGGHAYLINEWRLDNYIGIQNSWGRNWGTNGKAYISLSDFERLFKQYGEAITTVDLEDVVPPVVDPPVIDPPIVPPVIPKPIDGCLEVIKLLIKGGSNAR